MSKSQVGRKPTESRFKLIDSARAKMITREINSISKLPAYTLSEMFSTTVASRRQFPYVPKPDEPQRNNKWYKYQNGAPFDLKIIKLILKEYPKVARIYWHPIWTFFDKQSVVFDTIASFWLLPDSFAKIFPNALEDESGVWIKAPSKAVLEKILKRMSLDSLAYAIGLYNIRLSCSNRNDALSQKDLEFMRDTIVEYIEITLKKLGFAEAMPEFVKLLSNMEIDAHNGAIGYLSFKNTTWRSVLADAGGKLFIVVPKKDALRSNQVLLTPINIDLLDSHGRINQQHHLKLFHPHLKFKTSISVAVEY